MTPAISIIIPCYNREKFIGDAIQSALAQDLTLEVIVIDDGSTDRSWEIISSFRDVRATRTSNRGASAARNMGISLARGDFLRFHDSDDRIPPAALSRLLETARSIGPGQIAFGDARTIDERGQFCDGASYGFDHLPVGPITIEQLTSAVMSTVLPLFPKNAIEAVGGFDEALSISEDYELVARLAAHGYEFLHLPVIVAEIREHGNPRLSRDFGALGYGRQLTALSRAAQSIGAVSEAGLVGVAKIAWMLARAASRDRCRLEAENLFHFAEDLAGSRAHVGNPALQAAYRVLSPYRAERLLEVAKSILRGRSW